MGEPLVLVPGMMCDARIFMPQIIELSKDRAVQIAPTGQGNTVEALAEALLAGAPERFALVGLSLGGQVAMEVLRRAPDRVNRVALISTSATTETPQQAAEREPQIVRAMAGKLAEVMTEIMPPEYLFDGPVRAPILNLVQEMATRLGPEVFARQSHVLQTRPDQQRTLRTTKIPALIISGEVDRLTPPARHEFLAKMIQNAQLEIIPNAGHFPTVEASEAVNALLKGWLAGPLVLR